MSRGWSTCRLKVDNFVRLGDTVELKSRVELCGVGRRQQLEWGRDDAGGGYRISNKGGVGRQDS